MKHLLFLLLLVCAMRVQAQSADSMQVHRAALDYIEGFYEGDTLKLQRSLSHSLHKYGYYKNKTEQYEGSAMNYQQALDYSKNVLAKKKFAKPDAPKTVIVMDVQENIACAKVIAWWGLDYLHLSKQDGQWKIEQVLWQGPLKTLVK
ncbi:MAG: nuclear transport factor 2 family protein [Saprospiraceae bacterium]